MNSPDKPHVIRFHNVYHYSTSACKMVFLDLALTVADLPSDFVTERFDRFLDDVPNRLWKQNTRLGEAF